MALLSRPCEPRTSPGADEVPAPDDPETVAEANAHPEVLANKTVGQVADHYAEVIDGLDKQPAMLGH